MIEKFMVRMKLLLILLLITGFGGQSAETGRAAVFEPGKAWVDTDGSRIQAHGGGILHHNRVYYWFGENMDAPTTSHNVPLTGVSCYSSHDLHRWKNEGVVLAAVKDDPSHDLHPSNVIERPKVRQVGFFSFRPTVVTVAEPPPADIGSPLCPQHA